MKRAVIAVAMMCGYAWVVAGAAPFSANSYLLVAIASVALVVGYASIGGLSSHDPNASAYYEAKSGGASYATVTPWIVVLVAAVILEAIGLALGGRSSDVPTLSTMVDHLLEVRWERCLVCLTWLLVGWCPLLRLWQFSRIGKT
jgi:hypothetical protein